MRAKHQTDRGQYNNLQCTTFVPGQLARFLTPAFYFVVLVCSQKFLGVIFFCALCLGTGYFCCSKGVCPADLLEGRGWAMLCPLSCCIVAPT